ncbi:MAG: FAD-dependent oxidoreductase, partial [Chroococcales cyanobacterium]
MTLTERILSQLPGDALTGLHRSDRLWQSLKNNPQVIPSVVTEHSQPLNHLDWDILVCGGTLGIFIGAALAVKGWRVALIERGILRGRDQEWNISREELTVFLELDLLTEAELAQAIATQYNPARIQFNGGPEFWVRDVLNIGVDPVYLLDTLKARFLKAGGQIFEKTPFESASVHPNGIVVKSSNGQSFTARLLLDVMGHFSPIVRQIRQGQKPDSVCLVVGSCAKGFPQNETGDLITSFTPIQKQCQYFWEAFPARDGRTTYLFTYLDTHPSRLSLTELFEDYLKLLPEYQKVDLAQLEFVRALFGFFPAYRDSPVRSPWDRILAVGDSSGIQSPLSF